MKTKKFKRVLTLVLALAMMLSISMVAFASGSVTLYINGVSQGTFNIDDDSTVYDIVSQLSTATWTSESNAVPGYSPLCITGNALYGKYNSKIVYLTSLNGISSEPYVPVTGALDDDDFYDPTQTVDTVLIAANNALSDYGGLGYWLGDGYGFSRRGNHMIYIGYDWQFTVNGVTPGQHFDPADATYGDMFQYTMRETLLNNGDNIYLNYQYFFFVF